jgi:hypothetical protein
MTTTRKHARLIQHPFATHLLGARLDSLHQEKNGRSLHLVLDLQAFQQAAPGLMFARGDNLFERVAGTFIPARLQFQQVRNLQDGKLAAILPTLPLEDPGRIIRYHYSWRQPDRDDIFYIFTIQSPQAGDLMFSSSNVIYELDQNRPRPVTFERPWSPAPPMPAHLVPRPVSLHKKYGGDPITIHLNGHPFHHRLFIGGTDIQGTVRPQVDAVLNLGEEASRWQTAGDPPASDRWARKGEGAQGMSLDELLQEADWGIHRLKHGQRLLVHCVGGLNRSATICCAVLILLEGLSAEQALERLREHHPWARPDDRHWLKLRWLAKENTAVP